MLAYCAAPAHAERDRKRRPGSAKLTMPERCIAPRLGAVEPAGAENWEIGQRPQIGRLRVGASSRRLLCRAQTSSACNCRRPSCRRSQTGVSLGPRGGSFELDCVNVASPLHLCIRAEGLPPLSRRKRGVQLLICHLGGRAAQQRGIVAAEATVRALLPVHAITWPWSLWATIFHCKVENTARVAGFSIFNQSPRSIVKEGLNKGAGVRSRPLRLQQQVIV